LFGVAARIATAEAVILHKLLWHDTTPSERQLGDAAGIVAVQENRLDQDYLRRVALQLNVGQPLDDLLTGRIRPELT
jgi:hypothetical protein